MRAQLRFLWNRHRVSVEAEYAVEIAFLRETLEAFPAHVVTTRPSDRFVHLPDRDWTKGIEVELEKLRIRTIALSSPTSVWGKGSTALSHVDARFKEGDRIVDKGFVDTVLVGQHPRPTGSPHYRYRIELMRDGTFYAIEAILRN